MKEPPAFVVSGRRVRNAFAVGKFLEFAYPATKTFPAASRAIPAGLSLPLPPRYEEIVKDRPARAEFKILGKCELVNLNRLLSRTYRTQRVECGTQRQDCRTKPRRSFKLTWVLRQPTCGLRSCFNTPVVAGSARAANSEPRTRNCRCYSYRSATIGSTFIARRAGTKLAARATPVSTTAIRANVMGSVALTSKSRLDIRRVRNNDATRPIVTPASASNMPSPTTSFNTSDI